LTLRVGNRAVDIGLKELRRLPGSAHTTLEAVVPGRRGHAVRMGALLRSALVPEDATLRLVSRDGFARTLPAQALYAGGLLHWASDGHPLTAADGGPLRLYIVGGQDQCDNVKGLSEIAVVP
jgi:DMSO/TMAO reductase YedYZ molybdopterin-dependent catalytic subunit